MTNTTYLVREGRAFGERDKGASQGIGNPDARGQDQLRRAGFRSIVIVRAVSTRCLGVSENQAAEIQSSCHGCSKIRRCVGRCLKPGKDSTMSPLGLILVIILIIALLGGFSGRFGGYGYGYGHGYGYGYGHGGIGVIGIILI